MLPRPVKPENLSTPGIEWRQRKHHWIALWVARRDIAKSGYGLKSRRLWDARREPTLEEWAAISSQCEILQTEMLGWANSTPQAWDPRIIYDGTLGSLIDVYERDPDSSYQNLRRHTRQSYDSGLRTLKASIGAARVPALTFRDFKRWHEGFKQPRIDGGPHRISRAHRLMTLIRIVMSFGTLLRLTGCAEAEMTLGKMEFTMPKKRREFLTAAQVIAIRAEAHRRGRPSVALAQAMMFELMLRPKDVIGEWLPISEPGMSDVACHDEKWMHGAHWKEVSPDLIFTHRLSKSLRGRHATMDATAGKTERFDLKAYPMIMEELQHVPAEKRERAMVVCEYTGQPWRTKPFAAFWRSLATACGIPKNVQNRDSRAGGITEGRRSGATLEDLRHHAGHSQLSTTAGYDRNDIDDKNKVAQLRVRNRPQTP